jgi:hypothetical protein
MTIRNLAEVRARLEEAVAGLPGEPTGPADLFRRYEMVAIQVLDASHTEFYKGILSEWLMSFLYMKQLELGLLPLADDPIEQ